jgi:hypothetical protein
MSRKRARERGSALLTAAAMTIVLMLVLVGLVYYASRSRLRAITVSRSVSRISCADSGLQLARAYFGRNNALWNTTFLPNPNVYDGANAIAADATARANLISTHPELFADLDGDGLADVYLYVRDNVDEFLPNPNNLSRDNDLNVIIGAICISSTLVPRTEDGRQANAMMAEGLLSFNPTGS